MMKSRITAAGVLVALVASFDAHAQSTVISEDFTRGSTANSWFFYNGACLTAGQATGVEPSGTSPGQLPGCTTDSTVVAYYNQAQVGGWSGTLPDPLIAPATGPGEGALRFTNGSPGGYSQNGLILSNWTFGSGAGLQITFMTVSYRGDSNGYYKTAANPGDGADGMSFFLTDASQPFGPGAWGGSLGYSCSNTNPPFDGMEGAYLAVGMDEWGNFLNGATAMPASAWLNGVLNPNPNTISGDNTALGYGERPDRIGLRGQGNVSWAYLNATYGTVNSSYSVSPYYPSSLATTLDSNGRPYSQDAVQKTCSTGQLWNYSNPASPVLASTTKVTGNSPATPILASDYTPIPGAYVELPETGPNAVHIALENAQTRQQAQPIYYQLKLTQNGLLSFWYSLGGPSGVFLPVIKGQNITAPNSSGVPTNGALPANFRFGFGGSTGGSNNIHEILCFRAADLAQSSSGAGVNEKQSAKIESGIQAYFGYYNPNDSTGRLTAYSLGTDPTTGAVTIASTANWDASCVLSGTGPSGCSTTTSNAPMTAQPPTNRVMLTQSGTQGSGGGSAFEWSASGGVTGLTTTQQAALTAQDATANVPAYGQDRLQYLRGVRSDEIPATGAVSPQVFRKRDSVLGDIQNSSPSWVGPPQLPYNATWVDALDGSAGMPDNSMPENTGVSYTTYAGSGTGGQANRLNVVYVGANDGFVHGFRTGAFNADGSYNVNAPNDGLEVLAYMPNTVLQHIHNIVDATSTPNIDGTLDYTNPQYGHNFYVDATPGTWDLYYGGQWHTWVIGGLGAGGAAIYALDVTNPGTVGASGGVSGSSFAENNAANLVIGEWTPSNITCANNASCGQNLGNTYGVPQIRRLHNGQWAAIFGNGLGSTTGDAGIFIMLIDPTNPLTNAPTFYYLSTGTGTGTSTTPCTGSACNGISYVTPVDLDSDHIADYVYAGDLQGNMWRFDLTSPTPGSSSAPGTWVGTAPFKLFHTNAGQPITTSAVAASGLVGSTQQQVLMIIFGTGQKTSATNQTAVSYASGAQDLYGVWDWNLSAWNAKSSQQYASLTSLPTSVTSPLTQANLAGETVSVVTAAGPSQGDRDINTNATICWAGTTSCGTSPTANTQFGWFLPLVGANTVNGTTASNEQIIYNPELVNQAVVINSILPAANVPTSCQPSTDQGWTYGVNALTGGAFTNAFPQYYDSNAAGVQTNATGASFPVSSTGGTYLVYQTVLNNHGVTPIVLPPNSKAKRLTWVQRR
jgi:type IV pilus assembly protein PilY1